MLVSAALTCVWLAGYHSDHYALQLEVPSDKQKLGQS